MRIQCNISALPQYLARFAARYANLLRLLDFCKFARIRIANYGNFIIDEYTHTLHLESELSDLRVGMTHTDTVGILPSEEMERIGR